MNSIKNSGGFTLIELVVSVTISAVVIFAISSIAIFTTRVLSESGIGRDLQVDMNNLAHQITEGVFEPGSIDCGLRGAASYSITAGNHQIAFTDTALTTRSFTATSTSLIYASPTQNATIYTAPAGSIFNVIFNSNPLIPNFVNISMSVTQQVNGRPLTGSVVTSVYLRNAS